MNLRAYMIKYSDFFIIKLYTDDILLVCYDEAIIFLASATR